MKFQGLNEPGDHAYFDEFAERCGHYLLGAAYSGGFA
jgi:hypothetical protein